MALLRSWCVQTGTALPAELPEPERPGRDSNPRPVDPESITGSVPARSRRTSSRSWGAVGSRTRTARPGGRSTRDNRAAPARDDRQRAGPPGFEPGPARLELADARRYTTGLRSGRPGSNGPPRGGAPVLCRLSYVRVIRPAGVEPASSAVAEQRSSAELRACEKSLRQESNPHLGRTKGACLPLTLRRLEWRRGSRTRILLVASEVLSPVELHPQSKCERVESNHHSAWLRRYKPAELADAQRPRRRAADRIRTGTARITTSNAAVTPQPPGEGGDDRTRTGAVSVDNRALLPLSYAP